MIENTLWILHNTSNKSEHTPRGIIHFRSYDVTSYDITSNPVAILLPVMRNDTFYTNTIARKKRGENDVTSGRVTSSNAYAMARSPLLPPKYSLSCHDTLLWYLDWGDGIVLDHLGFKSKVLPGPLTDLSAWVGFCTSIDIWFFFYGGGGSL